MLRSLVKRANLSAIVNAKRRRLTIALYATAVFLYWMSLYLYVPTLPTWDLFKNNFVLLQSNHGDAKRGLMT